MLLKWKCPYILSLVPLNERLCRTDKGLFILLTKWKQKRTDSYKDANHYCSTTYTSSDEKCFVTDGESTIQVGC